MKYRFLLVVFNYERLELFFDNFKKFEGFDPNRDAVVIYDSSRSAKLELRKAENSLESLNLENGNNFFFLRRKNEGLDQGGRLDLLRDTLDGKFNSRYIFQFQEHFLDNNSPHAFYQNGAVNIDGGDFSGHLKHDVIPPGMTVDLDKCEELFENGIIAITHCQNGVHRGKIGSTEFFFVHGANVAVKTDHLKQVWSKKQIKLHKGISDTTYNWTLYFEFKFCMMLGTNDWYDVGSSQRYGLHELKTANLPEMEPQYESILVRYDKKLALFKKLYPISLIFHFLLKQIRPWR